MDVTPYLDLRIAPRAVFDSLAERADGVRFYVPSPPRDGAAGTDEWRAVTWGAFARQIRDCACFLSAIGLVSGERAAIFAPNRVEWISAALAIQAAGGVVVPIYPSNTASQAGYVAEHSDARVVFVDTAALLTRVLEAWPSYAAVERIVLLDDALDVPAVLAAVQQHPREGAAPADRA
ncbi:MAG: hypothetical protein NVS3B10_24660 [Polyangiales bacterium]